MDEEKLKKLANLAKIEILEEDKSKLLAMLNSDINTVKTIYNIDTDKLEPLTNPYDMQLEMHNDKISDGDKQELLMNCTPKNMYNYFIVPKVLEN